MMPASSSTYVQHALWNYTSRALREQKTKLLTARGPESTVCTASLRKSAEPAYWPRRGPALGQRCTRAGERSAGLFVCMTRTTRTCPNIRDLILKCTKTHESAQLGLGTQICVILAILELGTRTREVRERIVIKQSNAAQKSNNQIPLVIPPYHTTQKRIKTIKIPVAYW